MISTIRCFFRRLGIRIHRIRPTPFEHLRDMPRYHPATVKLKGKRFELGDAASFYWSYREIFMDEIYRFPSSTDAPMIIDCGANCGVGVAYFKQLYPMARITAVEADPAIFARLKRNVNCRGYSGVTLLNAAVTDRSGRVRFLPEGGDAGRIASSNTSKGVSVQAITLDDLIEGPVDFLKMDIEGAEYDAIASARRLDLVDKCFIECHSLAGEPQRMGELLTRLSAVGFRYYIHTQFCSSRPFVERRVQAEMDLQLNVFAMREKSK